MRQPEIVLLRSRRFLPLFVTQFLGAMNDNVFKNAFVILVLYGMAEVGGTNAQVLVTVAAGVFILPYFLFSATAGQLADAFEKSRLIRRIKLRSEEHTSELQSLMRISYAVFCLKKKKKTYKV